MMMMLQLQILFDDSLTETFEYPSEQSLMAATPAQPGDVDYEGEEFVHNSGLLVTPSIVAAGGFRSHFHLALVKCYFGHLCSQLTCLLRYWSVTMFLLATSITGEPLHRVPTHLESPGIEEVRESMRILLVIREK